MFTHPSTRRLALSRTAILALVSATVIGCKPKESETTPADTAAMMAPAPTGASAATRPADTTAGPSAGEVAADPSISGWTDENIVAKLEEGDTKEVELSRQVEPKLTEGDVKEYAHTLVTDHSKSRTDMRAMASREKLVAKQPAGDSSAKELADLKARFQKMPKGAAFDTAFVNGEIQDHRHDIADHRAMQAQAKSQALKDEIGKGLPVLQKHLDRAQELSRKLGGAHA